MVKYLIFDAGPIISMTMNGLLPILEKLKKEFNGEFILTPHVKKEVLDRPLKIKKYKLEAKQVENLLEKGLFKMSGDYVPNSKLNKEISNINQNLNSALRVKENNEKIKILQEGEISCLAFANLCDGECVIVVDERTVRLVSESPDNLKILMENKLHTNVYCNHEVLSKYTNYKFIRSAELIYVAYKKKLFDMEMNKDLLDALLYALKFKGTAISSQEIEDIKKMV